MIFLDASLADADAAASRASSTRCSCPTPTLSATARLDYEELIASGDPGFEFPDLDENAAAAMCYTSGTTGLPKGVVYSHRSTVLHSLLTNQADALGLRERDTVLPIVPMFHANAWGLPYAGDAGRQQARAARSADGPGEPRAADRRRAGHDLRRACRRSGRASPSSTPRPTCPRSSGSCAAAPLCPESLMRALRRALRRADHPGLGDDRDEPARLDLPASRRAAPEGDEAYALRALPGPRRPARRVPRSTRQAGGELQVRGPTIARAYYNDETGAEKFTEDGWLRTGRRRRDPGRRVHQARRPHQGPRQVGRRMDQLGRARERDHGPPGRARGRGHRDAGRALGRASVRVRGRRERQRARRRRPARVPRATASPSGGCPTASSSSTRCRRRRSASSTRRCSGRSSPRAAFERSVRRRTDAALALRCESCRVASSTSPG